MSNRILVVDDDPHIREVICFALEKEGMTAKVACHGAEALAFLERETPDLIILDVGMPEVDGLEFCRQVRKTSEVPIMFLSARDDEIDRVLGLEIGGDDYVTKPFSPRELIARIKVILKRHNAPGGARKADERSLSHGGLTLNRDRHQAVFEGKQLSLTSLEFAILVAFLTRPTFILTREQIIAAAYHDNIHVADRTVDSHIRNIRAKLSGLGCDSAIETVRGIGFRLGFCESRS